MQIATRPSGQDNTITIVDLSGKLATEAVAELEQVLTPLSTASQPRMVLNFAGVTHISSAILRVLLATLKNVQAASGRIIICGVNPHVEQVLKLSGFDTFFPIVEQEAEAVRQLVASA